MAHDNFFLFSVTPLDVVKIRLQAQKNPFPKGIMNMNHVSLVLHFFYKVHVRWPDLCFSWISFREMLCLLQWAYGPHMCVWKWQLQGLVQSPRSLQWHAGKEFTYLHVTIQIVDVCVCKAELHSHTVIEAAKQLVPLPNLLLCRMPSSRSYTVKG